MSIASGLPNATMYYTISNGGPFDDILTIKGSTKNIFFLRKLLSMKERLVDTTINFILKHFTIETYICILTRIIQF